MIPSSRCAIDVSAGNSVPGVPFLFLIAALTKVGYRDWIAAL